MRTRLWTIQRDKKLSLRKFAKLIGVSHATLSEFKRGNTTRLSSETMERCRDALGLPLDWLFPADLPVEQERSA